MTIWRSDDPLARWLRVVSVISTLALVVVAVLVPLFDPSQPDDIPLDALLIGAVLLQLGYDIIVPGLSRRVTGGPPRKESGHGG